MHNKTSPYKILRILLVSLLIAFLSISLFSACSSADATSKKSKSKKSKKSRDDVWDKEEEADADSKIEKSPEKSENSNTVSDSEKEETSPESNKENKRDVRDDSRSPKKDSKELADDIWADLMKGNKRFMAGRHTSINFSSRRRQLLKGQEPEVIVLGCADSRVPPELVFDKNLGELFVIREAGSIADQLSLGSIEYAVEHLHSKVLVVLGHESCGAVAATVSGEKMPTRNLQTIVESIAPAFEGSKTCQIGSPPNLSCVELNVQHSAKDILMKSPIIKKAVGAGELTIIRAVYRMESGEVVRLD